MKLARRKLLRLAAGAVALPTISRSQGRKRRPASICAMCHIAARGLR